METTHRATSLYLKEGKEKQIVSHFLRTTNLESMNAGKCILQVLINMHNFVSLNALLSAMDRPQVENGERWGWTNLKWELLSNKYGVCASHDKVTGRTNITLNLPPIERIDNAIDREIEYLKGEVEKLRKQEGMRKWQDEILTGLKKI